MPVATLGNWARRQQRDGTEATATPAAPASHAKPDISALKAEVSRLRKELASAKLDIETLSKVTAYFAKGSR